jgi:hypothetical protein
VWEVDPERLRSICGEVFEVADRSTWDRALAARSDNGLKWTPEAAFEFPPDLTSSEEDSDSSTTDMEDSDSSKPIWKKRLFPPHHPWRKTTQGLKK